ncbi:MAG TPA: hypothetical protein VGF74_20000, partial [Thermoleophilaceae bacterium]
MTRSCSRRAESGQALVLVIGAMAALVLGTLILGAFGQALGARGHEQRAADLAAVSAARAMRDAYPRLFEPATLRRGLPNPRHLSRAAYLALGRAAAVDGAKRNGATLVPGQVTFPDATSFAPVRVSVALTDRVLIRVPGRRNTARIRVVARATAALTPSAGPGAYPNADG